MIMIMIIIIMMMMMMIITIIIIIIVIIIFIIIIIVAPPFPLLSHIPYDEMNIEILHVNTSEIYLLIDWWKSDHYDGTNGSYLSDVSKSLRLKKNRFLNQ